MEAELTTAELTAELQLEALLTELLKAALTATKPTLTTGDAGGRAAGGDAGS
jgi:hypothetical protein